MNAYTDTHTSLFILCFHVRTCIYSYVYIIVAYFLYTHEHANTHSLIIESLEFWASWDYWKKIVNSIGEYYFIDVNKFDECINIMIHWN